MKKIIMVLVIFISSIIFYDSYVNLSQKQYNDVINMSYKFAQENDMEVVPIDLQLSEEKQERTEQFNQVYSFLWFKTLDLLLMNLFNIYCSLLFFLYFV